MSEINLKRAYDAASTTDGYRIYVDRLWPQGLSHETFHYDLWAKDVAPDTELRHWFHEDPAGRWNEFARRYSESLAGSEALTELLDVVRRHPRVTLLYSSKNRDDNNAVVLRDVLLRAMSAK